MDNTKFNLVSIILLVVLIGLGALAIITLTPPKRYSATTARTTPVATVPENVETPLAQTPEPATTPVTSTTPAATTTQHAALIADIEAMIKAKTILKAGDKGPNVGTIQTFFNLYNKTSTRVDNDFGPGLTSTVKSFQSKNNITPQSGQVAEKTMTQMVTWLKSQN